MLKRDIEFLFEIGWLKNVDRSWAQSLAMPCASVLDHTIRVVFIALLLARREGVAGSDERIIKMALAHDLSETRTGDTNYVHAVYTTRDEERAARDLFAGTVFSDFDKKILREYEARKTIESRIVKDADNLDVDVELKELEERGSLLPAKWRKLRRFVRDKKLYTKSAKLFWDELQRADPAAWHLKANKWAKLKDAGR